MSFFKKIKEKRKFNQLQQRVHTNMAEAVDLANDRRKDSVLMKEINDFLGDDIPAHFRAETPIFYFSRYLATPDYETLFYIEQVKKYGFPTIIGEDTKDIITSHSALKRNLLKLPVVVGESKSGKGIVEYKRVADLNTEQGKAIDQATLLNNKKLIALHHYLTEKLFPKNVKIVDESNWVDRNSRGELISLYERMLALLIAHGVMLEVYEPHEADFLEETVVPAMKATEARFGCKPLIVPLDQKVNNKIPDYNHYPKTVLQHIEVFMKE